MHVRLRVQPVCDVDDHLPLCGQAREQRPGSRSPCRRPRTRCRAGTPRQRVTTRRPQVAARRRRTGHGSVPGTVANGRSGAAGAPGSSRAAGSAGGGPSAGGAGLGCGGPSGGLARRPIDAGAADAHDDHDRAYRGEAGGNRDPHDPASDLLLLGSGQDSNLRPLRYEGWVAHVGGCGGPGWNWVCAGPSTLMGWSAPTSGHVHAGAVDK